MFPTDEFNKFSIPAGVEQAGCLPAHTTVPAPQAAILNKTRILDKENLISH